MSAPQTQPSGAARASCLGASAALELAAGRLAADARLHAERHIEACPACEFVVATALEQHALATLEAGTNAQVGMLLAQRYRLLRLAGRGGMGDVFEAQDELLDARIAVKCLAPRWAESASARARLKREVLLARRVSHPNVARVFDFGSHAQAGGKSVSFLTMEFVEGGSLRRHIAGRSQSAEQVLAIVRQLLLALAQAHRVGVLHRDLKSDNVLLRESQACSAPSVVVTDFGLARAITPERTHVSASHLFLGTPGYLAPEQIQGGRLTVRTDLYSLGVVTFELLTGSLPFLCDTPLATAMQRLQRRAPRASERASSVTSVWDAFVARCLEREPARRFASAEQAYAALQPLLDERARLHTTRSNRRTGACGVALGLLLGVTLAELPERSITQHAPLPGPDVTRLDPVALPSAPRLRSAPFQQLARSQAEQVGIVELAPRQREPAASSAVARGQSDIATQVAPHADVATIATADDLSNVDADDFIDPFAGSD